MTKRLLINLAAGSLILFIIISWLISSRFMEEPLWLRMKGDGHLGLQLLLGIGLGLFWGYLGKFLVGRSYFEEVFQKFTELIGSMRLNKLEIWWVSICAGVGEEILFRGTIQPFLGVWITSILFVFIHGYLTPFNTRLSIYGIFMTLAIVTLGYTVEYVGLIPAMVAHTIIDVILLSYLTSAYRRLNPEEIPPE